MTPEVTLRSHTDTHMYIHVYTSHISDFFQVAALLRYNHIRHIDITPKVMKEIFGKCLKCRKVCGCLCNCCVQSKENLGEIFFIKTRKPSKIPNYCLVDESEQICVDFILESWSGKTKLKRSQEIPEILWLSKG